MATAKKTVKAKAPARKAPARKATPPKAAVKPPVRPAPVPTGSVAAAPKATPAKPEKPKKPKLVRDSFTIPKSEYAVLADLKQRAAKLGEPAKKSEVLRAGIKVLAVMGDLAFTAALRAVPTLKTGRPAKN